MPDPIETLKAAETLVQQGLSCCPLLRADPVLCKRLEEVGCAAVMPLGAPIGSNQDRRNPRHAGDDDRATVPVVVDAGIGVQPCRAGAGNGGRRGVRVNTAIVADDPVNGAKAFRLAVEAGLLGTPQSDRSRSYLLMPPARDRISGGIGMKPSAIAGDNWTGTTSAHINGKPAADGRALNASQPP